MAHNRIVSPLTHSGPSSLPGSSSLVSSSHAASQNSFCSEQFSLHFQLANFSHSDHYLPLNVLLALCSHINTEFGGPPMEFTIVPQPTGCHTWGLAPHTKDFGLCPEGHVGHRKSSVGE